MNTFFYITFNSLLCFCLAEDTFKRAWPVGNFSYTPGNFIPMNFSFTPMNFSFAPMNFSFAPMNFSFAPMNFTLPSGNFTPTSFTTKNFNAEIIKDGMFVGKRKRDKRQWCRNTATVNSDSVNGGSFVGKRRSKGELEN